MASALDRKSQIAEQLEREVLKVSSGFEGMRATLATGRPAFAPLLPAFALNAVYLALAGAFFGWMMSRVREKGYLARLAME